MAAPLQSNPALFSVRFSSAEINSHQTQISRDKLLSNKLNVQIAAHMLAFSRGSDIKQSLTSSQFQLQYDFQPLTFPRKAATTCEKDGVRSGKLSKNATAQATTTSKPTPQSQPPYLRTRQCKTQQQLGFHT